MENLLIQLAATSFLEGIAVVLAVVYVWLAARQNIWCWPCALVSTGIYTWLFWNVSLPFHTGLNFYYLIMAVYGLMKWRESQADTLLVQSWPLSRHIICIIVLTIGSVTLSYFASSMLDADHIYLDAFITVFSVYTTILVAHKVRENWLYWIVINIFASYLYFAKDLTLTGILFLCYTGFAVYGFIQWRIEPANVEGQTKPL
ncbi:nicotinamide riboside transporter PnuC [uncultured Paraglaciecola sp.]|jgi:nicotinamide mononucleotide transporter|uniref:nicotinamide riboside transporter PnuC n=1 Tax=uncultured Paraglaciecola sp. TaxID=1765024 RepID=UPI0025DCF086|nr:nicotinamide riboside transporter PnuC [uncultured Paraglaciecola sp.]